jgi:hypothetical protein
MYNEEIVEVKNIEAKIASIGTAQAACSAINSHLGNESISKEVFAMLSELKVDLYEIQYQNKLKLIAQNS